MPPRPACSADRASDMTPEQKKTNLRLGLILASIAMMFFFGFIFRMAFMGR